MEFVKMVVAILITAVVLILGVNSAAKAMAQSVAFEIEGVKRVTVAVAMVGN